MRRLFNAVVDFYWGSGIADDVPALTYYLVISLAPFALGLTALAALIFGNGVSGQDISNELGVVLPTQVADQLSSLVQQNQSSSGILLFFSIAAMLWTTSGAIGVIERVLSRTLPRERHSIVLGKIRNLAIGALLAALVIASAAFASLTSGLDFLPDGVWASRMIFLGNFIGIVLFVSLIYKLTPRGGVRWVPSIIGAVPAAVVIQVTPLLVGAYFSVVTRVAPATIFFSMAIIIGACFLIATGLLVGAGIAASRERGKSITKSLSEEDV